ncbi:glycosyltransferase family 4 protein [Chengkuizengella marina]|uniref:Glycosyltransferase n=1 Tax=Chengkuizengella marina TaxID=2507566 RepID=A0A6N9Q3F8_9BACL|nr:glycosyltransferase family 4 protein [Chengkuizengella marina]NBI29332.1 glycosyltransferase [Chengkuizengella marina]
MLNILVITPWLPYPVNDGGSIASMSSIICLDKLGHNVHLATFAEIDDSNIEHNKNKLLCKACIKNILIFRKEIKMNSKLLFKNLFSVNSILINRYYSKKILNDIVVYCNKNNIDVLWVDQLWPTVYVKKLKKILPNLKIIYREHNVESDLLKQKIKKQRFLKKFFLLTQISLVKKFEKNLFNYLDFTIVLSKEDKQLLDIPPNKSEVIPFGLDDNEQPIGNFNTKPNLVFVGSLEYIPNNEGIEWFLDEVVSKLNLSEVKVFIIGKGANDKLKKKVAAFPNVKLLGFVDDLSSFLLKSNIFIVPLLSGSGIRLKVLEAMRKGIPIISTSKGIEGIQLSHFEDVLIADTPKLFSEHVNLLLKNQKQRELLSKYSRQKFELMYSNDVIAKKISKVIKKLDI